MRLLGDCVTLLEAYNVNPRCAKRYNPAAERVYRERSRIGNPLSQEFEPHIVYGLRQFDMSRTMGPDFSIRLRSALQGLRALQFVGEFHDHHLGSIDLTSCGLEIRKVYEHLAPAGILHPGNQSHVAATKILHWLFPDLFLMLDSKVAGVFQRNFEVGYVKSTQPGYSAEKYIQCLCHAQAEIEIFGKDRFAMLEVATPEARIFDKIAWASST